MFWPAVLLTFERDVVYELYYSFGCLRRLNLHIHDRVHVGRRVSRLSSHL